MNRFARMRKPSRQSGFTILELLISTAIGTVLLFGAIYSSMETFAVVQAGDSRLNTQVHARRVLERLVKDCRYSTELEITGDEADGWQLAITTGADDTEWTWTWNPATDTLSVSDGESAEDIVTNLEGFALEAQLNGSSEVERITMLWTLREVAGNAGGGTVADTTVTFPGSTWVRANAD